MKKRVFVSFDFDNDKRLKDFIIGQSRLADSPFEVIDNSLKEAAPEKNWVAKANAAILRSDIVIVMVGPQTYRAGGVLKEIAMAQAAGKKIVQVIGYKGPRLHSSSWGRTTLSLELGEPQKALGVSEDLTRGVASGKRSFSSHSC